VELLTSLSVTTLMMLGSALGIGVAVFLLVRGLYPEEILREVNEKAREARTRQEEASAKGYVPPPPPGRMRAFGGALVAKIGNYNKPLVRAKYQQRMNRRFLALGRPEYRPEDFLAHQQIWTVFFGLFGLALMNVLGFSLWYSLAFAVFGWVYPHIWLRDRIKKRQNAIRRALPYNIDLLTLSVEAGLDFQAALGTVVDRGQPGPLIEELNMMLNEIRLGTTRAEALRNLAVRVQIPEISAFVANMIQADRMGTSLGKVLRIQSNQIRIARTHRAERLANEAPVKMLLPLIGCIFPTVFLILFGPIVYRLLQGYF
jgi:tight adherence protein C